MMPSRNMIRYWLQTFTRNEILAELEKIKAEHGDDAEQDVRDFLNHEREEKRKYEDEQGQLYAAGKIKELKPFVLCSPAEQSIMSEHEEWKAKVQADIEFQKKLHKDAS